MEPLIIIKRILKQMALKQNEEKKLQLENKVAFLSYMKKQTSLKVWKFTFTKQVAVNICMHIVKRHAMLHCLLDFIQRK